ncbi:MAG TPA: pilus assembly protein TadG-related protein [Chloroflexota bacterium]|nr:pilus assembly protein TadG-related protein [Chloroflexota bacterium]
MTPWETCAERAERGAIAPLVALLLIPLLGMLALTVDVGFAYGQRRLSQNVADNAALNGAVVVGKRLQAPSETWVKDGDVIAAITAVTSRSSGGYVFGAGLTAEYVRYETNGSLTKVGDVGIGSLCQSDGTSGCIPSTATGVRVLTRITFDTFFAPVLSRTSLSTGARATALNATVTSIRVAPYALWTGERGVGQLQGGGAAPNYLCVDGSGQPQLLTIGGSTVDAPAGSYRSPSGKAYDYSCTGGTSNPITPGTVFTIRSAPNFETPNVSVGNTNWQVGASNFKGFLRIDDPNGLVGAGDYLSDGGIAGGAEDAAMNIISECYRLNCTLVMPVVSYGVADQANGQPALLVTGFASVTVRSVNTQDPTTAQSSYEWRARVENSPIVCCPVDYTYQVTPGSSQLLYTRLYE